MSMRAITWAMDAATGYPSRKLILIMLADNANEEGLSCPTANELARACEMSVKSVKRHIAALHDEGLLTVFHDREEGVYLSNYYCLHIHPGEHHER